MSKILICEYCEQEYDYDVAYPDVVTPKKYCSPACEDEDDDGPAGSLGTVAYGERRVSLEES